MSNAVAYVTNVTTVTRFYRLTRIRGEGKDIGCRSFLHCLEILLYLVLHTIKSSIKAFNQGIFLSKYKNTKKIVLFPKKTISYKEEEKTKDFVRVRNCKQLIFQVHQL